MVCYKTANEVTEFRWKENVCFPPFQNSNHSSSDNKTKRQYNSKMITLVNHHKLIINQNNEKKNKTKKTNTVEGLFR